MIALALAAVLLPAGYGFVPGTFEPGRQPDGNSVFIAAPDGLILVDTGRHRAHQDRLLAYARNAKRPVAAIVNTHWHLDHTGGNAEIRAAFPQARVHASRAIDGALTGFLAQSRKDAEAYIAGGKAPPEQVAEIEGDFAAMDDTASLRPGVPVTASGPMTIAGRALEVNLAPHAATEGDVWIYDPQAKAVVAGDLVVGPVPFLDTACPDGWRTALDAIAAKDFAVLFPGHGDPMTRPQFLAWRTAYNNLLDCAASDKAKADCIAGWNRDAAQFLPAGRKVDGMIDYYLTSRLRAAPAERDLHCAPSAGAGSRG